MGRGEGCELWLSDFSPAAIAESGQCFRMRRIGEHRFALIACGQYLEIESCDQEESGQEHAKTQQKADSRQDMKPGAHRAVSGICGGQGAEIEKKRFRFSCCRETFASVWRPYFDLDTDYETYRALVLPDDHYLASAVRFGAGIRVLRQEPWEALISFIISQRRSVPAIRTAVEKLSAAFGTPLKEQSLPEEMSAQKDGGRKPAVHAASELGLYAFPTPEQLANAPLDGLLGCGLGYRAPYVAEAARRVASGILDLDLLAYCPTEELIATLMQERGVGIKVASCAALFGWHRLEVMPVDVWMKRVLDTAYGGDFPAEYRPAAGVLQQYLFYYARLNGVGAER